MVKNNKQNEHTKLELRLGGRANPYFKKEKDLPTKEKEVEKESKERATLMRVRNFRRIIIIMF